MLRKTLIVANVILLLTACTLPFAKDRSIEGALERFVAEYNSDPIHGEFTRSDRKVFSEALLRMKERYVDEVDPDKLVDVALKELAMGRESDEEALTLAINAVLSSLDPYSAYMTPEAYQRYQDNLEGKFVGFGVRIEMRDGKLTVITPIKGSPAEKAGIQPNDIISHLNGSPIKGLSLIKAVEKLRGPEGSLAELTIVRENISEPIRLKIRRQAVDIEPVEYRVDGDVGYIRIQTFNRKTSESVDEALDVFNAKLGSSLCGVILDMRNNPGGLVTSAVDVADQFLEQGNIFAAENRGHAFSKEDAVPGDRINGKPIVVLINNGSASAAEIVAGALQGQERAKIMGQTSYGKGTMQTLFDLDNGGGLRLTTGRFTAGGKASFNGVGIKPDITDSSQANEDELAPIARAGSVLNCHLSVQTAATANMQ
ncbi:S41 family peptidase [Sneathiella glossodoripedis]|uniref:S41 family peptidase n=1 Tax=Sneathiella glossodoripedis TaxID=418853 RepID=UPI0004720BAD|nr:S41 family peptidase [Sneathiella glossodoripedis]